MKKVLLSIFFVFAAIASANAVIAYPHPVKVTQPDGTVITIQLHGDEYLHWATCGNSLVAKGPDGYWHYSSFGANPSGAGTLGARVKATASGDGSLVTPPAHLVADALGKRKENALNTQNTSNSAISADTKHFLILLIEFADKSFTMDKSDFNGLLNGVNYTYNGATGSVNKYYKDVSFNKFNPVFDIYGPIRVSNTSAYYADNTSEAVVEACQWAHANLGLDFSKYCNVDRERVDNVFFFFPGYNAAEGGGDDTIWPHAGFRSYPFLTIDGVGIYQYGCTSEFKGSSGNVMAGIGTFCHEFGHVIGLPDFYDVDYEENGYTNALSTLSLMSSGNYNNEGRTPPYMTYEEKHILGWDEGLTLLSSGSNTLLKTSQNKTYYFPTSNEGEYFLLESRPSEGWDTYTGTKGLAIYHVDKSDNILPDGITAREHFEAGYMINAFAAHQCMDLIETVPESQLQYTDQLTFPGPEGRDAFTATSTPAQQPWNGCPTGYNLTGIYFNNSTGTTSVTVGKETKIVGNVRNYDGDAIAGAEITVTAQTMFSPVVRNGVNSVKLYGVKKASGAAEYHAVSGYDGSFAIDLSQGGTYLVKITKFGYTEFSTSVTVNAISNVNAYLALPVDLSGIELRKYTDFTGNLVGYGSGVDCYAGLRYTSSELLPYVGSTISSISFLIFKNSEDTFDKVGVKVYFGDECVYDKECRDVTFGSMYTANIEDADLRIPGGVDVTFVYYVINPSFGWSMAVADNGNPVEGGNLVNSVNNLNWQTYNGNLVISANVINNNEIFNLSGLNYIAHAPQYSAGDKFELKLVESSVNPLSSVSWTVNGQTASGSVTLKAGTTVVQAHLTYSSGRTETVEVRLKVVN